MSEVGRRDRRLPWIPRPRVSIGLKFVLVVAMLATALLVMGLVGVRQAQVINSETSQVRTDTKSLQKLADLRNSFTDVGLAALALVPAQDRAEVQHVRAHLDRAVAQLERDLAEFQRAYGQDATRAGHVSGQIDESWQQLHALVNSPGLRNPAPQGQVGATRNAANAQRVESIMDRIRATTDEIRSRELAEAAENFAAAQAAYEHSRQLLRLILVLAVIVAVGAVLWLVRDIVPRVRGYSHFAGQVAAGQPVSSMPVDGRDELAELGRALNTMVAAREEVLTREKAARVASSAYEQAQGELNRFLQYARNEDEAYDLIKRHLERSIPDSGAVVLNRNNSADWLEPMTSFPTRSRLASTLVGAEPRSCLAVRLGQAYERCPDQNGLVACDVCGTEERCTTCQPLLVAGEVLGSVLVETADPLGAQEKTCMTDTVSEAAPILANLRNLAIAQFRAVNDPLTGLPNKRAVEETLRRMVAQADRTATPLAAIMLDLDHFKQVNDTYGHAAGDDVLATTSEVLRGALRASDFAGRYGGEEFLVLLSMTDQPGAVQVAEKIRTAVAGMQVSSVDRSLTVSLGVAVLPDDAGDAVTLLRQADRALYAAKAGGRDRVAVAELRDKPEPGSWPNVPEPSPPSDGEAGDRTADSLVSDS